MKNIPRCIVCNKSDFCELFQTKDRMFNILGMFSVNKCNHCGLVFQSPQPTPQILKKHYPKQQYYSYKKSITGLSGLISKFRTYLINHYYEPSLLSTAFSAIVKGVPAIPHKPKIKNAKILDVGCGSGATLELLKDLGWNVYGLEIDKNAVMAANERGLENVKIGGYEKIATFPNNYFDCIRLYHVIEHVQNPCECLNLIHKKLKPGGEILLGTPNINSVVGKMFGIHWYNLDIPRHLFIFSPKTLSSVVKDQQFRKISIEFCSSDGFGRSIIYVLNNLLDKKMDTNKFTLLFFILYPFEWLFDKLKVGDIMILRGKK
jgi:2-polyprenyl-3-methyl-5-hydroxy-6-metoxy-1,4-benzoquinol methylase